MDEVLVEESDPTLADGPEPELGLERDTQLPHHDHVEGSTQGAGHLGGDRDAAPRQCQHDRTLPPQELPTPRRGDARPPVCP